MPARQTTKPNALTKLNWSPLYSTAKTNWKISYKNIQKICFKFTFDAIYIKLKLTLNMPAIDKVKLDVFDNTINSLTSMKKAKVAPADIFNITIYMASSW